MNFRRFADALRFGALGALLLGGMVLPQAVQAQTITPNAYQNFEASPTPTALPYTIGGTGGSTLSATNSGTPATPFAVEGATGTAFVASNTGTANPATLTFNSVNLAGYSGVQVRFRVASFSGTSGNGADAGDTVTASISANGGAFVDTARIAGNNNARWDYNSGTGTVNATYDGTTLTSVAPTSGGARTTDGYSTVVINIPGTVNQLQLRITCLNNDANERWAIDDVRITGSAPAPGTLQFNPSSYTVNESVGSAALTVTRTGGSVGSISATYATADGSAIAGSDYTAITGTVTFADGETASKTINVPIIDDATAESAESFTVNLSGASAGTPSSATVTILDNDAPNNAPVANNDSYSTVRNNTLTVAAANGVLANDTDADGNTLTVADADTATAGIQPITGPANGTLTLNLDGSFTYVPNSNFSGMDTFTYRATDGVANSNIATVTITVTTIKLVISEVYGGGGNANAPYQNDFIEIYNYGTTSVDLSGYSVQYASSSGAFGSNITQLTGTIRPGAYYLVQEAGGTTGSPLPAPDATGTIAMSATTGKVALAKVTAGVSGSSDPNVIDFVGFGTANDFETAVAPAPSNTNSIARINPTVDGNNNSTDFAAGSPTPQNLASSPQVATTGIIISEFRLSGPSSGTDEFVELYNNTGTRLNVTGWTLTAGPATVTLSGSVESRAHLLVTGTGYSTGSLASYGSSDLSFPAGTDIPLSATLTLSNANGVTIDQVNATQALVPVSSASDYSFVRRFETGIPQDTDNDASDFSLVDINTDSTSPGATGLQTPVDLSGRLGAPGPQGRVDATSRNNRISVAYFGGASSVKTASSGTTPLDPLGRLALRRTITNNSAGNVTKIRFRLAAVTAGGRASAPGTVADLRAISSTTATINGQTVYGATLDAPSTVNGNGGGLNSSWTVTLPPGVAFNNGDSINVEFLFGIIKGGNFRYTIDTELY